jgi:hypothetical protein
LGEASSKQPAAAAAAAQTYCNMLQHVLSLAEFLLLHYMLLLQ